MRSRLSAEGGEAGREPGVEGSDPAVLNVLELFADPRPLPRARGVKDVALAAPRPSSNQS